METINKYFFIILFCSLFISLSLAYDCEVSYQNEFVKNEAKGIDTVYICSKKNGNIYFERTGNKPENKIEFIVK